MGEQYQQRSEVMSDRINVNDAVRCVWGDDTATCGIVINIPAAIGEMWIIKKEDGDVFYINPCSSNLDCIIKEGNDDSE